jgi:hypothetical protein
MTEADHSYPHLKPAQLWFGVGAPPILWAFHLAAAYAFLSVSCHRGWLQGTILGFHALNFIAVVFTVVVGLGILAAGLTAYRNLQRLDAHGGDALDIREERALFMTRSGILLSGIFLLGLVLALVPMIVLNPCVF